MQPTIAASRAKTSPATSRVATLIVSDYCLSPGRDLPLTTRADSSYRVQMYRVHASSYLTES